MKRIMHPNSHSAEETEMNNISLVFLNCFLVVVRLCCVFLFFVFILVTLTSLHSYSFAFVLGFFDYDMLVFLHHVLSHDPLG